MSRAPAEPGPGARVKRSLRGDIQGLRVIAVLLVFADHLFSKPAGGFIGVDVFFVISGYLITGLLVREGKRTGGISIREFYARRIRRIVPLAVLVILATNIGARLIFSTARAAQTATDSIWALLFGANIHFSRIGTDYFQQNRPPSPVQHYWSLSVEEQFYAFWPLLLLGAFVAARRMRLRPTSLVLPLALIAVVASFVWCQATIGDNATRAYFATTVRAWELGIGALVAIAQPALSRLPARGRAGAAWAGLGGIALSACTVSGTTPWPGSAALLPVLATALVLGADDPKGGPGAVGLLDNAPVRYLGSLSYSLYLWHWPAIVLATGYFAHRGVGFFLCAGVLPFVLSALSFQLVEGPIHHSAWLSKEPRRPNRSGGHERPTHGRGPLVVAFGLLILTAVALAATVIRTPTPASVAAAAPGTSFGSTPAAVGVPFPGGVPGVVPPAVDPIAAALDVTAWPDLTPSLEGLTGDMVPEWRDNQCLYVDTVKKMDDCVFGDKTASRTVVVTGDSMALSYMPGIRAALADQGWRIQLLTHGECPDVTLKVWVPEKGRHVASQDCLRHRTFEMDQIRRIKPDLVISSSESSIELDRVVGGPGGEAGLPAWQDSVQQWFTGVRPFTKRIVLLSAPPGGANLQICARGQNPKPSACTTVVPALWSATAEAERAAAAEVGVDYVNPETWFCYQQRCPAVVGSTPVYWDGQHLTATASRALKAQLEPVLLPADPGLTGTAPGT